MIDRDLAARDLELLAALLAPAIEARLALLRSIPVVGPRLLSLLRGSPRSMTSDALASVLRLPDGELAELVDLVGRELGAWRGALTPVTPAEAEAARPAYEHLVELA
jgi:hypothetical protein